MRLRVSAWAVRHPIPVTVLFLALTIAGLAAYRALPVKQFPDVSFPVVQVIVTQNAAAPAELETQVTRVAEDAVAGIAGVRHVSSTVAAGQSQTVVEFVLGTDPQRAIDEVRTAVARVRTALPRSIDEPVVERVEADAVPILTYGVAAPALSEAELSRFVDDRLVRRLQAIRGVARVARVGGVEREIEVLLDPARLAAHGLTAPQVGDVLRGVAADAPGGRTGIGGVERSVRVLGGTDTVARLAALTIPTGGGRFVPLAAVADIGDGAGGRRGFACLNGRPVIGFDVTKTKAASDVAVEDAVAAELAAVARQHPDVAITRIVSSVDDTRASFSATVDVLVEGMVLAALTVFAFLRSWRSTLIAAIAMPLSLVPTFAAMLALGFSLNTVTLLGLTLVIGILVDDAIVEIENIEKRIERGEAPYRAALLGADEIGLAVVATTAAIVVVFLPVSLMGGVVGQYFREFGITVAVAVVSSLLVARLLTPLLSAHLLRAAAHPPARRPFDGRYRRTLDCALLRPGRAIAAAGLFLAGSLWLATLLPTGFLPGSDPTAIVLDIVGPPGATPEAMQRGLARVTAALGRDPDVALVFVRTDPADPATGTMTVAFRPDRRSTAKAFKARIQPLLDASTQVLVSNQGDGGGVADLEIGLAGDDGSRLEIAAEQARRAIAGVPGIVNVRPATVPAGPELIVRPRIEEAARAGVDAETIAAIVRIATVGDVDANVAKLGEGERRIPIRTRLPDAARDDLAALSALPVPTASGGTTRLDAVADLSFGASPAAIERLDRERRVVIRADLRGRTLGDAIAAIDALPAMQSLPAGVHRVAFGDAEYLDELFGGFAGAMAAGVALIYAVLVLLFGGFLKPVTILSALPLSLGGAFAALLATRLDLTLSSLIGLLMLLGLSAKNSILLVEYAIERERAGVGRYEALVEACRERARPIVMTTFAMAAGMLPTALGLGKGADFRQPMAVAVIGGLASSTVLSLVLVPVVYELVERSETWSRQWFRHLQLRY